MTAAQIPLVITQGATLAKVLRWGASDPTYKAISGITNAAPAVVTAPGHGLVEGWPVLISDVVGMARPQADYPQVNDPYEFRKATSVDTNSFALLSLNTSCYGDYTRGGVVTYYAPVDLTDFTARAQIRSSVVATTALLELTTANGGIVLDNSAKTITLAQTAAETAAFDWRRGVWSLEMVSGAGVVTAIVPTSPVTVSQEVTR